LIDIFSEMLKVPEECKEKRLSAAGRSKRRLAARHRLSCCGERVDPFRCLSHGPSSVRQMSRSYNKLSLADTISGIAEGLDPIAWEAFNRRTVERIPERDDPLDALFDLILGKRRAYARHHSPLTVPGEEKAGRWALLRQFRQLVNAFYAPWKTNAIVASYVGGVFHADGAELGAECPRERGSNRLPHCAKLGRTAGENEDIGLASLTFLQQCDRFGLMFQVRQRSASHSALRDRFRSFEAELLVVFRDASFSCRAAAGRRLATHSLDNVVEALIGRAG